MIVATHLLVLLVLLVLRMMRVIGLHVHRDWFDVFVWQVDETVLFLLPNQRLCVA